jgi:hypothetical protein
MRNISFSLTTPQFLDRSKDVTRRLNWLKLRVGDHLMACEKCQGIKPGESIVRLGKIIVAEVTREPLNSMLKDLNYGRLEVVREGFPLLSPAEFVSMFCRHLACRPETIITRIVFQYPENAPTVPTAGLTTTDS